MSKNSLEFLDPFEGINTDYVAQRVRHTLRDYDLETIFEMNELTSQDVGVLMFELGYIGLPDDSEDAEEDEPDFFEGEDE